MNFTQEKIDDLNALLKVNLSPEDYLPKVDGALKNIQKKASMPGFRPGKVPAGLVKKMYGKSVLIDEINKVLNESIQQYISDNQMELLGQPLPKTDGHPEIDWDGQREFEFIYEMGLAPEVKVDLANAGTFEFRTVKVGDDMVEQEVNDMKKRYGNVSNPDQPEGSDRLFGDFNELDESGEIKPGGIFKSSSFAFDKVERESLKEELKHLAKGTGITLNPADISSNAVDLAAMLGIESSAVATLPTAFRFTLKNISRVSPAEENEEFYNKIYGPEISTPEAFREKIKNEIAAMFNKDSEKLFMNSVIKHFLEQQPLQLPEEFLKRWLVAISEKPVTPAQVAEEFPSYAERLRTQLIINKIIKNYGIKVTPEEVEAYISDLIRKQFSNYNQDEMPEEELKNTVKRILANEKEYNRVVEMLYDRSLMNLFKTHVKMQVVEVGVEDFYKG